MLCDAGVYTETDENHCPGKHKYLRAVYISKLDTILDPNLSKKASFLSKTVPYLTNKAPFLANSNLSKKVPFLSKKVPYLTKKAPFLTNSGPKGYQIC